MGMAAILVMWPENSYHKESSKEIWLQLALWFLRKLFEYIDGTPIWMTLAERSTLTFGTYYRHRLITFNISSKNLWLQQYSKNQLLKQKNPI